MKASCGKIARERACCWISIAKKDRIQHELPVDSSGDGTTHHGIRERAFLGIKLDQCHWINHRVTICSN